MKCPRDKTRLKEISTDGIKVSVCPCCRRRLIHQDQIESIKAKTKFNYPNTRRTSLEVLDVMHLADFVGELLGSVFDGASNLIDLQAKTITTLTEQCR
jgi:hypothetical protein